MQLLISNGAVVAALTGQSITVDGDAGTAVVEGGLDEFPEEAAGAGTALRAEGDLPPIMRVAEFEGNAAVVGVPDMLPPGGMFEVLAAVQLKKLEVLGEEFPILLKDPKYSDKSIKPVQPLSPPLKDVPLTDNFRRGIFEDVFDYICTPDGVGVYVSTISYTRPPTAFGTPTLDFNFRKTVDCSAAPLPSPSPSPSPSPAPDIDVVCDDILFGLEVTLTKVTDPTGQIAFFPGALPCDGSEIIIDVDDGMLILIDNVPAGQGGIPILEGNSGPLPGPGGQNVFLRQDEELCAFSATGTDTIGGVPGVPVVAKGTFVITLMGEVVDFVMVYFWGKDAPTALFSGAPTEFTCDQIGPAEVQVP